MSYAVFQPVAIAGSTVELVPSSRVILKVNEGMTIDDIACFQMGTHPALTASPVVYQFVTAAESALPAAQ